jgi:four helix bundle protein
LNGISSVEDLEVFKKTHALTLKVYEVSREFPPEERFGLTSQVRRSAASIGANLMEGGHRLNRKEFRQFVGMAKGSTGELKYHLLLAKHLNYLSGEVYQELRSGLEEISKMLNGLIKSLSEPK